MTPRVLEKLCPEQVCFDFRSGGVRARFRVRFQALKVQIFGGLPVENPTNKATGLKALLRATSLSEYGSEGFRVRLRRLSEYGFRCLLSWKTNTGNTGRTVLGHRPIRSRAEHGFGEYRFQTPSSCSEFFGAHWVPGSELSELLFAYYLLGIWGGGGG